MAILKAYATTPHGQVHYRYALPPDSSASSFPTLLLLHKSASSSASMIKLMFHFSSLGYPCYAPDMPGFGNSFDPSPSDISVIEKEGIVWYCNLYISVFTNLGFWNVKNGGVHIIGHHSGAALAPQLAVLAPDIVASICLVGPTVVGERERIAMREKFMVPFNTPEPSGAHLQKTWDYLGRMGVTSAGSGSSPPKECSDEDLELWQRELLDHVRAWKGRLQIYGAVWAVDAEHLFLQVKCPVLALCARDDVLWEHLGYVKKVRPNDASVGVAEVKGANFSVDRDAVGVIEVWKPFLEKARD
ncbi:alpha/beta-hydrolase [Amniculicola lignicola CBS 123094]|uniref:Alpha/beta-hydrolase n=1 Tax=Amniculicola lignicola CBS 123094 TaxID=1392246 RepID=A0A6A5WIB7_9PLEO|nr:alpha/beta-hydrolase [Amniculicola lignicola CBS 123094]